MTLFLLQRLLALVVTLAVASLVIFVVLDILPGNAAQMLLGADATPDTVAALSHKLGLDRPAPERYLGWVGGMVTGDWGTSATYDAPAAGLIFERASVSLPLAVMAIALSTVLALTLGVFAASRHGKLGDVGVMAASQVGLAVPSFWLAILLVLLFAVQLRWASAGGFPGWEAGWWPALKALILPAVSLAVVQSAILARVTRAAVVEVMREDFIRTARAKGLTRRAALWRHGLRNALIPVVTIMGLQFANLVAGAVIIENVFTLPGIGRLIFQSITNRDAVVVRDGVMLLAATVVGVNFAVDLAYAVIDPRLRAGGLG